MSKRAPRKSQTAPAPQPALARAVRRWALGGVLVAVIVAAGWAAWQHHNRTVWLAKLPPVPDLSARSPALRWRIDEAEAGLARRVGDSDALLELALLYHANGFTAEAQRCWETFAELQPREGRWRYYLADLARQHADEEGLRRELQATVERSPEYSPAWLELADMAFKRGELASAEQAYRRRLELLPADPHARLGLARLRLQGGRTDEAEKLLQEILRDAPNFPSVRNIYAELLEARGDVAGAREQRWLGRVAGRFHKAEDPWLLALRPYCFDAYQLAVWGSQEEQSKRPGQARALFERAMEVAPDQPVAYGELGQLLLDGGELEKARDVLVRGLERAPFHEKTALRLSVALRELGRGQEALENDQRALAREPESPEFLNSLGQSQALLGRLAEAEQTFQAALRRSPNAVGPKVNLGVVYLKTGRRAEARALLEAALEVNPGYPKLLVVLGRMALEDHRLDDAEKYIRPYFQQYPGNGNARSMWTQLHLERASEALAARDFAGAERWCNAGLSAVPDAAELLGLLGTVQLQQGDVARALPTLEACQRLRPGDPRAVLPLAMLYKELRRPADARRVLTEARAWLTRNGGEKFVAQIDAMLRALPPE